MRFKTATFEVDVKMKPSGNELLIKEPVIRMRTVDGKLVEKVRVVAKSRFQRQGKNLATDLKLIDPATQQEVPLSEALEILDNFKYKYLAEDGAEIEEEGILYYSVQEDGSEEECSPFEPTRLFDVSKEEDWVPSTTIESFLITEVYEIFAEDKKEALALFEEAEKRWKADQMCIISFSHGRGFKAYYAFICPLFQDGKFVWLLKKTDKKLAYNYMIEPPVAIKVPIREAPTLKVLPPIQAVVAVTKKKTRK